MPNLEKRTGKAKARWRRECRRVEINEKYPPLPSPPQTYLLRDEVLLSLGFSSYAEYLNSDLWKKIRGKVLVNGVKCKGCDGVPTQIHHMGYGKKTLLGEKLTALIPCCRRCHYIVEFTSDGRKRTFLESHTRAQYIFQRRRRPMPDFLKKQVKDDNA